VGNAAGTLCSLVGTLSRRLSTALQCHSVLTGARGGRCQLLLDKVREGAGFGAPFARSASRFRRQASPRSSLAQTIAELPKADACVWRPVR
jgi:hypothetical protein